MGSTIDLNVQTIEPFLHDVYSTGDVMVSSATPYECHLNFEEPLNV